MRALATVAKWTAVTVGMIILLTVMVGSLWVAAQSGQ